MSQILAKKTYCEVGYKHALCFELWPSEARPVAASEARRTLGMKKIRKIFAYQFWRRCATYGEMPPEIVLIWAGKIDAEYSKNN